MNKPIGTIDGDLLLEWLKQRTEWFEARMPNEQYGETTWIY